MSEKDRNAEEIIEDTLDDTARDVQTIIDDVENIEFKDIKSRLEFESERFTKAKFYSENIKVSYDDMDEAIKEINENDSLSQEEKQLKIAEVEDIYENGRNFIEGNHIEILKDVIRKTNSLMIENYMDALNQTETLVLSDDFEEIINQYNVNVDAVTDFSNSTGVTGFDFEKLDINTTQVREDGNKFKEFHSTFDKANIMFENLDEKIDTVNGLLDSNPNYINVIKDAEVLAMYGDDILEIKQRELLQKQKKLNITNEEAKIYDEANSNEEFVELMVNSNKEALQLQNTIETLKFETAEIRKKMRKLDENSEEYKQLESDLESKIPVLVDAKNNFKDMQKSFLSRKSVLDNFEKESGKEVEEYNKLYDKVKSLKTRAKIMSRNYNAYKSRINKEAENKLNKKITEGQEITDTTEQKEQTNEQEIENPASPSNDEPIVNETSDEKEEEKDKSQQSPDKSSEESNSDKESKKQSAKVKSNNGGYQVVQVPVQNTSGDSQVMQETADSDEQKLEEASEKQDNPQNPEWHKDLTEAQIEELTEEGIMPGDPEYNLYLRNHGIRLESTKEDKTEQTASEKDEQVEQDEPNNENEKESEEKNDNGQLIQVTDTQNARNIVDQFLKSSTEEQKMFLNKGNGYVKLSDAIEALTCSDNNSKLSRKERKNILNIVNSEMRYSLSEEALNENKGDILNLFDKLSIGKSKENEDLFNELFEYNKSTKLPFISESLIERKDQAKLAELIELYRIELAEGNLSESEIKNFERFIVNPLNANVIKQDVAGMGFFSRMKEKFLRKSNIKTGRALNSSLKDLNEATKHSREERFSAGPIDLGDSVYSDSESAKNQVEREKNQTNNQPVVNQEQQK